MKFSTLALASPIMLMSFINTTLGAVVVQSNDAAGYDTDPRSVNVTGLPYPVVDAVYSGEIDGHAFEVTGHYEKALTQLSAKYPGINLNNTGVNASYIPHGAAGGKLAERGGKVNYFLFLPFRFGKTDRRFQIVPPLCFPRSDNEWPDTIWDGAEWAARDVLGRAGTTRIEGRSCVRMFCGEFLYHHSRQWPTAIYACNDVSYNL